ncbi:MAG TPA: hypothetical protein VF995_11055 [Actinomycetota bacterium]
MQFGISLLPDASPQTKPATDYYRDVLRLCRVADEAGFGYVKMTEYFRVWLDATESWNATRSKDYQSYTGMSYFLRGLTPTAWREAGSAMVGSPERIVDRLHEFQEAAGLDTIFWQVDFGAVGGQLAERSLRLFIDKVLPKVSDL